MLNYLLRNSLFGKYQIGRFQMEDYKTMCMLMKQKFPIYNESVVLNKEVKLLDENSKLIGKYSAA